MVRRKAFTAFFSCLCMLILIFDGKTALEGARIGIDLCLNVVFPSLFPFLVLSTLLNGTLSGVHLPIMTLAAKLLGIPKGSESILISGFLGGYPAGAQSITEFYKEGILSKAEAEKMLAFCNNAGPAFLFGMVSTMFTQAWRTWALWFIHILSALLVAQHFPAKIQTDQAKTPRHFSISDALISGLYVISVVCGWVILFRILITFLKKWLLWLLPVSVQTILIGFLELSNGCYELSSILSESHRFLICSVILGFGGLCVTMQTASVTGELSLRYYFRGKCMQTVFSFLLACSAEYSILLPVCAVFFLMFLRLQKRSSNPAAVHV